MRLKNWPKWKNCPYAAQTKPPQAVTTYEYGIKNPRRPKDLPNQTPLHLKPARHKFVIYGLYDPRDNKLRYVGQTRLGVEKRLFHHIQSASNSSKQSPVTNWIRALNASQIRPAIKILKIVNPGSKNIQKQLNDAEYIHIASARLKDPTLLNVSSGGDRKYRRSAVPAWKRVPPCPR